MLVHSGGKPHKCKHCDYASNQANNLNAHIKMHSAEKKYTCNQCDYTSLRAIGKWHKRIHTREKPYKCNICDNEFTQSTHLRTHVKVHNKNEKSK